VTLPTRIIGWRAWYTGGRTFDSATTEWEDLPDDGVVLIMLYQDVRDSSNFFLRRGMSGADYYFKSGDIYGSGFHDDEIPRRYPGASIKRGKWTTEEEMYAVTEEANRERFVPGM
jgi:hypothetical protein